MAGRHSISAAALLLTIIWLGTFVLGASPRLHEWLHQDASNPDHHCLLTQIQKDPVIFGFENATFIHAPILEISPVPTAEPLPLASFRSGLPHTRGPPPAASSGFIG